MAVILHIETSTSVCSVALSDEETCIAEKSSLKGPSHNELLSPFIQEMLDIAKKKQLRFDAIAVSEGPGSYTGLRIGVATAKGLCFGFVHRPTKRKKFDFFLWEPMQKAKRRL